MNNGGCPFYQFGMTLPPSADAEDDGGGDGGGDGGNAGDGPASPASAADADDTVQPGTFQMAENDAGAGGVGADTGDDTPAQVRGALIQLLGGHVTGLVSQNVALVGQPTTTDDEPDEAGDEPDEAGDEPDEAGDEPDEAGDGDAEAGKDDEPGEDAEPEDKEAFQPDALTSEHLSGVGLSANVPRYGAAPDTWRVHTDAIAGELSAHPAFQKFARDVVGDPNSGPFRVPHEHLEADRPQASPGQIATEALSLHWDGRGGVRNPHSLILQRAIHAELGSGQAVLSHADPDALKESARLEAANPHWHPALRAWARAQYAHTQAHFAQQGVRSVALSRGMMVKHSDLRGVPLRASLTTPMLNALDANESYESPRAKIALQPASSYTSVPAVGGAFARSDWSDGHPITTASTFPVSSILGSHATGLGSRMLSEHVVLGGPHVGFVSVGRAGAAPIGDDRLSFPTTHGKKRTG